MLLKNWQETWWDDLIPEVDDSLDARGDKSFVSKSHHPKLVRDELQAMDQNYRLIITDMSEKNDDWIRIHHDLPHHSRDRGRVMAFNTVPLAQRRKWLRLQRLQLYLTQDSKKYRDLNHVIGQLMEFFDDKQLARIHDYLTRMPKIFRKGDHDRACYILACLDLELERHGYTILRHELLDQINHRLDLHVTKRDIRKAKWQVLKIDARLCKTRLQERMKHGPQRQRLISVNLLGKLVDNNPIIKTILKKCQLSMRTFKQMVMTMWDFHRQCSQRPHTSGHAWLRSDLEGTIAACVDLTLRHLHRSRGLSYDQLVLKWLPDTLKPHVSSIRTIRKKIITSISGKLILSKASSQKTDQKLNEGEHHAVKHSHGENYCSNSSTAPSKSVNASHDDISAHNVSTNSVRYQRFLESSTIRNSQVIDEEGEDFIVISQFVIINMKKTGMSLGDQNVRDYG